MVVIRLIGCHGEAVAHGHTGEGHDWHLDQLLMENNQAVARAWEEGGLLQVPHRGQDQGCRRYAGTYSQSRVAIKTTASIFS
jgi:hypothetical protein